MLSTKSQIKSSIPAKMRKTLVLMKNYVNKETDDTKNDKRKQYLKSLNDIEKNNVKNIPENDMELQYKNV